MKFIPLEQLFLLICVGTGFVAMLTGEYREFLAYSKLKFVRVSSVIAYYFVILVLWVSAGYFFKVTPCCNPLFLHGHVRLSLNGHQIPWMSIFLYHLFILSICRGENNHWHRLTVRLNHRTTSMLTNWGCIVSSFFRVREWGRKSMGENEKVEGSFTFLTVL